VHVRDLKNGSSTDVCSKHRTDGLRESAIITVEPKSLTFIHTIRKAGGPGESEMGAFPMLYGMHGLPAIAMLQPEVFLNVQMLPGLPGGLFGEPFHGLMVLPRIDSEEMARRMADAKKQLEKIRPQMDKQMKLFKSPEMQKQMEDLKQKLDQLKDQKPDGNAKPE
jgi:hypothetical protein